MVDKCEIVGLDVLLSRVQDRTEAMGLGIKSDEHKLSWTLSYFGILKGI